MDEITRLELEANGVEVITRATLDPHFKTKTFIKLNGLDLPWYDVLYEVPHLNNNDQYAMPLTCVPSEAQVEDLRTALWDDIVTYETTAEGQTLPIWWLALALLTIKVVGAILIFVCVYYILERIFAPCGIAGSQMIINECWKIVIMPDCQRREFNSCTGPDENGDGKPDGEWVGDWEGGVDWAAYLIIGIAIVGAIIIIPPLLRAVRPKAQPPPDYYPPPAPRYPPPRYPT